MAALFLLTLLVGIIELGRAFFYMNATAEATRLGARIAVVCEKDATDGIHPRTDARVRQRAAGRPTSAIQWDPANCTADGPTVCRSVTVSVLPGATFDTFIPFVPLTWTLPPFATTLPRESMSSAIEGATNPVCN